MGFMDKAKKMAQQAQDKLDEQQQKFNAAQAGTASATGQAAVEYDQHGRPVKAGPDPVTPVDADPEPVVAPGSVAPPPGIGHPDALGPKDNLAVPEQPAGGPQATEAEAAALSGEEVLTPPSEIDADAAPADAEPSAPSAPAEPRKDGDYTPPPMSSGDPLAG